MKASIVTFIRAYNHGAVLQCYALQKKLCAIGVNNEVLDYSPHYFYEEYQRAYQKSASIAPYFPLRKWWYNLPMVLRLKERNRNFERFIFNHIKMSKKKYCSTEEVQRESFDYDVYITGSDQVWRYIPGEFDPVFFLDFPAAEKTEKVSFAASFGMEELPTEVRDEYHRRLKDFSLLSVREQSGVAIIRDLLNREAMLCCDPTLLLNRKQWECLIPKRKKRKPYIFVYYVVGCEKLFRSAVKLAADKGLEIYSVTSQISYEGLVGSFANDYHINHMGSCGPDEFLEMISGAEYVLTDSFHGTVFSVIFQKRFLTLIHQQTGKRNSRAVNLLNELSLQNRFLDDGLEIIDDEINWEEVDSHLNRLREVSADYLRKIRR